MPFYSFTLKLIWKFKAIAQANDAIPVLIRVTVTVILIM